MTKNESLRLPEHRCLRKYSFVVSQSQDFVAMSTRRKRFAMHNSKGFVITGEQQVTFRLQGRWTTSLYFWAVKENRS